MFWWGRVNAVFAIIAFGGSIIAALNGAWAFIVLIWLGIIVLRVVLVVVNTIWTAIAGWPLFYDTQFRDLRRNRADE